MLWSHLCFSAEFAVEVATTSIHAMEFVFRRYSLIRLPRHCSRFTVPSPGLARLRLVADFLVSLILNFVLL